MSAINWSTIFKQYKGLWVALKDDEKTVIASGKTAKEAQEIALRKGYREPILTRMPERIVPYVGFGL